MIEQASKNHSYVILSIIAPLIVFLITLLWIYPDLSPIGIAEEEKLHPDVQEIEDRLEKTKPEIILVGSSVANKSVDEKSLAKELGLEVDAVQKIWSGRAMLPTILLMIQERILMAEHKPKTIIVFATPAWMLSNEVMDQKEFDKHWTKELDSELERVLEFEPSWKRTYFKKRAETQDGVQNLVRYWFGEKPFALSEDKVSEQLDVLFDFENERKDQVKEQKLIQHNVQKKEEKPAWSVIPSEEDLLIYHLIEQVKAQGINIILVEVPVSNTVKEVNRVPEELAFSLVEQYAELGAGHLYYFDWNPEDIFSDLIHMNDRGRVLFTKMLAKDLQKIGILEKEIKVAELPKELTKPILNWPSREGVLGRQEALDIQFSYRWKNVQLKICASGRHKLKNSMIRVDGKIVETKKDWGSEVWCEEVQLGDVGKDSKIQIQNDEKMPLILHKIYINEVDILKTPYPLVPKPESEILKEVEPSQVGIIPDKKLSPFWKIKKEELPFLKIGKLTGYLEMDEMTTLVEGVPWECFPLEVSYKGESFSSTRKVCKTILKDLNKGNNCFVKGRWIYFGKEEIDWTALFLGLKKNRTCSNAKSKYKSSWWVYPNDSIRLSFGYLKGHYSLLRLKGTIFGRGKWHIQVKNAQTVFLDTTITNLDFILEEMLDIPIRHKVDPNIVVEISALEGSDNYLFIEYIELSN